MTAMRKAIIALIFIAICSDFGAAGAIAAANYADECNTEAPKIFKKVSNFSEKRKVNPFSTGLVKKVAKKVRKPKADCVTTAKLPVEQAPAKIVIGELLIPTVPDAEVLPEPQTVASAKALEPMPVIALHQDQTQPVAYAQLVPREFAQVFAPQFIGASYLSAVYLTQAPNPFYQSHEIVLLRTNADQRDAVVSEPSSLAMLVLGVFMFRKRIFARKHFK